MTLNEPGTVGLASGSITSACRSVSSNGTSSKTIKFNNGNYSKSSLQNAVYDLFKNASSLNVNSTHRYIYNIAYPLSVFSTNGKFTYTVANLITAPPQLIFPSTSVLHRPLGFNVESTNTFSSLGSLSSSNCHGVIPMCPPGGTYSIGRDSHFPTTDLRSAPGWGPDHTLTRETQGAYRTAPGPET